MASSPRSGELTSQLEPLLDAARTLAERIALGAAGTTTLGRERAILRLLGVGGLDHDGRPLAAEVVDRFVSGRADRLAVGIALPFAAALLEYETTPQALALDVAAGTIDLALEATLLEVPESRAAAADHLSTLVGAAVDQIDANRVARQELLGVLRDRRPPWVGTTLHAGSIEEAVDEAATLISGDLDLLRVEIPVIRELATHLGLLGQDTGWQPRDLAAADEPIPTGSQRGLARLRQVLDQAAAARGAYVRLVLAPTAFAGPEGAVVAALERADILDLDPMADVVMTGVDPERALLDFAFAVRVARRAGVAVLLDAGPLVVAPDLAAGVNADAATRSGRALALQLITASLATAEGLPAGQLLVGALPGWLIGESESAARVAADIELRRSLFGAHPLAFVEPAGPDPALEWHAIVAATQPGSGVHLVLRRATRFPEAAIRDVARSRIAARLALDLERNFSRRDLEGTAREHADRAISAAIATVQQIAADGWPALTGAGSGTADWGRLGADAVAPASDSFDIIERALA